MVVAVISLSLVLGGCGTSVSVKEDGAVCKQVRNSKFLGITYSKNEAVVRCP